MSFFEDASLVMIPSGYKTSKVYSVKPTDGTGDLTFSRSLDTATRVAENGLIERVRTNLILQSNDFGNAAWTKIGASVTQGATAPDGTATAWTFQSTAAGTAQISVAITGTNTLSIFAKAGNISIFSIWIGSAVTFNLATGIVTAGTGSMVNVGNGWYRCIVPFTTAGSFNPFINASASGENVLIAFAQAELGDIATPYIPTTTAAVSVGMLANVPRLDYTGGGCPKLLLEPQRSNVWLNSEQAASWSAVEVSVISNSVNSPSGTQSADTITSSTVSSIHLIGFDTAAIISGTAYSASMFVKANTGRFFQILGGGSAFDGNSYANFDLQTGTVTLQGSSATAKIVNYGNGWYRCEVTATATTTASSGFYGGIITSASAIRAQVHTTALSYYVWGCGLEAGAYATSYIPTLGAAVTRSADAASKTGISALIGQTEGTLFVEFQKNVGLDAANMVFSLSDGTSSNLIYYNLDGGVVEILAGGVLVASKAGIVLQNGTNKIAVCYKLNDFAIYLNGASIHTDTSGAVPTMSKLNVGNWFNDTFPIGSSINQTLIFKTRLTNAALAELTA